MRRFIPFLILVVFLATVAGGSAQEATSPEDHFGHIVGADRKLIDWEGIVDYMHILDGQSERIALRELGQTTLGKPFLLVTISSEENLRNLDRYRRIQQQIAHPYGLDAEAAEKLIDEGKIVVLVSMNIHSTEIASSQESVELAYELALGNDKRTRHILDNVILLMIPSLNPDGLQMVIDWYEEHLGTAYEGCRLPWLYHHYAGHDDNRDWFFFNLQESRLTAKILYDEWFPEIVYDQHQMGSTGARLFLPPYADPINLNVHPMLMAEVNMLGKHVVADLHAQGFTGIETGRRFNAFYEGTMSKTPLWHNMVGILSEMASVRLATPIFLPRGSLRNHGSELPQLSSGNDFLDPWEGGWWRLRDIVDYEKAVTYSILDLAATYRKQFMMNFYTMNANSIARGKTEAPYAYIVPVDQHDPSSAETMLTILKHNGIRIYCAGSPFEHASIRYPEGTFIIPLAQPCRPAIKDLMEVQRYPDLFTYPGGPPLRPYDFTSWTLPLLMGVRVVTADSPIDVRFQPPERFDFGTVGVIDPESKLYLIERRFNNAFGLVNDLIQSGTTVYWSDEPFENSGHRFPAGTFIVPGGNGMKERIDALSHRWRLPVRGVNETISVRGWKTSAVRLATYQPWTANMDEGWTRLVLDNFAFAHRALHNEDIRKGKLHQKLDAIILPSMSTEGIVEGRRGWDDDPILGTPEMPEKYKGGIGKEGTGALLDFVRNGGTLIALGEASNFVIDKIRVPAVNTLKNVRSNDYYAPGSLLRMELDTGASLAFGMPDHAAVRVINSPAFRLLPYNDEIDAAGFYGENNPLLSGWLIGHDKITGKTILADIPVEEGRIVMFGFGVQSRAQTYGTFKLLFNAIYQGACEPVASLEVLKH